MCSYYLWLLMGLKTSGISASAQRQLTATLCRYAISRFGCLFLVSCFPPEGDGVPEINNIRSWAMVVRMCIPFIELVLPAFASSPYFATLCVDVGLLKGWSWVVHVHIHEERTLKRTHKVARPPATYPQTQTTWTYVYIPYPTKESI